MTSPEPCENCGRAVMLLRSLAREGSCALWEDIGDVSIRFHSDGSTAARQAMFVPHTPDRCRSARRTEETPDART